MLPPTIVFFKKSQAFDSPSSSKSLLIYLQVNFKRKSYLIPRTGISSFTTKETDTA